MASYRICEEHATDSADAHRLQSSLDEHNMSVTRQHEFWPVVLCLRGEQGELRGGLTGTVWGGWLHIQVLWLEEDCRRAGYGSRLLQTAETYARRRGARHAHASTFSFQAPDFYLGHGYEAFGELADYPEGQKQIFLRKNLVP